MTVTISGNNYYSDKDSDTMEGTAANNYMSGGEGDDTIKGMDGNDTIDGGVGNDNLNGGDGNDTIYDVNSIPSGFVGLIGHDTIHAGNGNDRVFVTSPDTGDFAYGDSGEDTIYIWFYATMPTPAPIVFSLLQTGSTCTLDGINTVFVQGFERLNFVGNIGADFIEGGALDDHISGAGGNDTLRGFGGDDTLDGGTGVQNIDGGDDFDTASFDLSTVTDSLDITLSNNISLGAWGSIKKVEAFAEVMTGSGADKIVNGDFGGEFSTNGGNDEFTGGKGDEIWNMGTGQDSGTLGAGSDQARVDGLQYDTGVKKVHGGAGNDYLFGAAGNDFLYGDGDNDFINGQNGNDHIEGGAGSDTIRGGGGDDNIAGGTGNDYIDGDLDDYSDTYTTGSDILTGGSGDDGLSGGLGADELNGGDGNDDLSLWWETSTVDTAVDHVDGGKGKDTLVLSWFNSQDWTYAIRVTGTTITAKVNGGLVADAINVESFRLQANGGGTYDYFGSDGIDTIAIGSAATGNDTIKTFGGNDNIGTSTGSDTVDAGDGNDSINVMLGGADKIRAGIGNDYLLIQTATWFTPEKGDVGIFDLGAGKDKLEINAWNHDIEFVDGKNIMLDGELIAKVSNWETLRYNASTFATEFVGTDKDEEVNCQLGNDVIKTMGGNDFVHGHGGNDTLDGGAGSDTAAYWYNFSKSVEVTLNGSKFVNVFVGGVAEDKIRNFENVIGGQLGDKLNGDKNKNTLDGGSGDDVLNGGDGDDRLIGNVGRDTLTGGAGDDVFAFTWPPQSPAFGRDLITDFKRGQDHIDLSDVDANSSTVKNDAFTFLTSEGAAFSGTAGQVRFDKQGSITIFEIDVNGDKFADMQVELTGAINLAKSDFML